MIIKNFLFHRVTDEEDALWPPMKVDLFRRIIHHLKKNYEVISLEAWLSDPAAFRRSSKTFATVLFDDGYKDNIEYAAPVLKEQNCAASFYIATDCINRNIPTWTYIIDYSLQYTQRKTIDIGLDYVPEKFRKLDLLAPSLKELKPWMKKLPNSKRKEVMERVVAECNDVELPHTMMNWDDIRQLKQSGFVIGSHSHTHPMLGRLEDEGEIEEELVLSRDILINELHEQPAVISYPIGSFDERVKRLSVKCGYKWGLAVEQKFLDTGAMDMMAIPRVELYQEPWWKVRARVHGIYNRVKQLW